MPSYLDSLDSNIFQYRCFLWKSVKSKGQQLQEVGVLSIENLVHQPFRQCVLHVIPLRAPAFAVSLSPRWDLVPHAGKLAAYGKIMLMIMPNKPRDYFPHLWAFTPSSFVVPCSLFRSPPFQPNQVSASKGRLASACSCNLGQQRGYVWSIACHFPIFPCWRFQYHG